MMMEAIEYEALVCTAFACSRNYDNGADADIYRRMERACRNLELKTMFATQDEREYEFKVSFAKVRGYVEDALQEGLKKMRYSNNDQAKQRLRQLSAVFTIHFFDKEKLDEIIEEANQIFLDNNL